MKDNLKYFTDILNNKFAEFKGRAGRKEYWMYVMWLSIFYMAIVIISALLMGTKYVYIFSVVPTMLTVLTIIPSISLNVRRLHDIGKDWQWIFISLIPVVGIIWYITLVVKKSQEGENKFGECPVE